MIDLGCKLCRYTFHKEKRMNNSLFISLIEKKTGKKVGYMLFCNEACIYLAQFEIELDERNKGHGSRLIRLLQFIANHENKHIEVDVSQEDKGFFVKHGFSLVKEDVWGINNPTLFNLVPMRWTPKALLNTSR